MATKPECIVWIDELELALQPAAADSSGAPQSLLAGIMATMEQAGAQGLIMAGPPGTAKALIDDIGRRQLATALMSTIGLRVGSPALKAAAVGQSEQDGYQAWIAWRKSLARNK